MTAIPGQIELAYSEEREFRAALGENFFRKMGSTVNYALLMSELQAIGSIKKAALTEAQFQAQLGTTWVLMDGRDITGSDLHALTGISQLTDARGTFLRCADNGAGVDPNGVGPNSLEFDNLGYHDHAVNRSDGNSVAYGGGPTPNVTVPVNFFDAGIGRYDFAGTHITVTALKTAAVGNIQPETRPTNITINFFIKINVANVE